MNLLARLSPRWRVAWFLFAAAGLNYADRAVLGSVVPPLRAELGATDVDIGVMGALFLWSYAIMSPFAGWVADRWSRRRIVVWSLAAWSVVTLLNGLVQSVPQMHCVRIALGIAESFYLPAAGALLADYHGTESRGRAMGLHVFGLNLGALVGGTFAGVVAEHYGWRQPFVVLGVAGTLLALCSPVFFEHGRVTLSAARVVSPTFGETWAYLLRVPSYFALLFSGMVAAVASWTFFTWLPLYFSESYGFKLGAAGLAGVALYKLPVLLGIGGGGWISDKLARLEIRNRALLKGATLIVSGPILLMFTGAPTFTVVAAALAASSLIRAIGVPSEHPILCDVVPARFRATAIGILNTCGTAAGGLGVLLGGMFKRDLGLATIFAASSGLFVLSGMGMILAYFFFMARDVDRATAAELSASVPENGVATPRSA